MSLRTLVVTSVCFLSLCRIAGASTAITDCGQVVPRSTSAVLQRDLSCTGHDFAVRLDRQATLDLNGFSITYFPTRAFPRAAVLCATSHGRAADCRVHDRAGGGALRQGEPSTTGGAGIVGRGLTVEGVHLEGSGAVAHRLKALDLTVTDVPDVGILATHFVGEGIVAQRNEYGIYAGRLRLESATISDNTTAGAHADRRAVIRSSTLTGNRLGDIVSSERPHVHDTICGTSRVFSGPPIGNESWGVCPGE